MKTEVDGSIFRHSDIRGRYPEEINDSAVYAIGRALAILFKSKRFIVGFDNRVSSRGLYSALSKGIMDMGGEVICIGCVDTPRVYFASGKYNVPGIMITASHNPANFNGIKIVDSKVVPLGEKNGLRKLKEIVIKGDFSGTDKKGREVKKDIDRDYLKHLFSFVSPMDINGLRLVIDSGNGVSGKFVNTLCLALKIKASKLYFKSDGKFPNHVPNPLIEKNTLKLSKEVVRFGADFGVAFDGDADRVFFVDELGRRINSSLIACLIISELHEHHKGSVIYNSPSSRIIGEIAKLYRIPSFREKVGHAYIKLRMRQTNSFFASEHSGHFYFRDNFYSDSAFIAFLLICKIYSEAKKDGKKFSEIIEPYRRYVTSEEINLSCSDSDRLIKSLNMSFRKVKGAKIDLFDGLTVNMGDWWFNVRKSGNENLVRINLEARNKQLFDEKLKYIFNIIGSTCHARRL